MKKVNTSCFSGRDEEAETPPDGEGCFSGQNADTVRLLATAKQDREELQGAKQDLENLLEHLRQEKRNMVRSGAEPGISSGRG